MDSSAASYVTRPEDGVVEQGVALGDTTKALNAGDGRRVIGSIGVGFSY